VTRDGRLLVIGASGILAPLVAALAVEGRAITAVGRRAQRLPGPPLAEPLASDTTTAAGAAAVAANGPYEAAVMYRPAVAAETLTVLLAAVSGRAVIVLPRSAADPETGHDPAHLGGALRPRPADGLLVLGWRTDPPRWHSPEEVSRAAAQVLACGEDAVLGALRPWSERPR
jgi:hypothetical protein